MTEIKTNKRHLERPIEIKRWHSNELLITSATWYHLDGPSKIQRPRLNHNDSQSCISFELLIKD